MLGGFVGIRANRAENGGTVGIARGVVGGAGFCVRAMVEGLFRVPPLDPARRERLRTWGERLPVTRLAHWAARLDRRVAGRGRQRTARASVGAPPIRLALKWWDCDVPQYGNLTPVAHDCLLSRESPQHPL